ncbi:hypothetical protein WJ47_16815 [Burkholderia ubonensis]|uniref:Uncharacterized protein n=1 Tax=Burkholderia ubonensis TaxID=101571 RepID=A0AB73FU84_9BURK|nr:hypothetical protein WJ44_19780 [Burkholderia ubonensis]KVL62253.1 hypothetical protein WJ47_16815 [Burkholderia ubonensis]KVM22021.1 hypothetical protein WJ53_19385 [Burkholderia ubonensis]KVM33609.1 hypothetical protein WJ54_06720 [Burkholderia ubonensis]
MSTRTADLSTLEQLSSSGWYRFAMLRWRNRSSGTLYVMVSAGTRLSQQPIHIERVEEAGRAFARSRVSRTQAMLQPACIWHESSRHLCN